MIQTLIVLVLLIFAGYHVVKNHAEIMEDYNANN